MKILYAVQATGNGHISRAVQLTPHLQKLGQVDIFLSGQNCTLPVNLPIKYTSKGLSLFYGHHGGLSLTDIVKKNSWTTVIKQAKALPTEQYDLVINDFEPIAALSCKIKKKASIQISHQASFRSQLSPRPKVRNPLGEWILKEYATSTHYIGLHFQSYDDFILPPIIKQNILSSTPQDQGHITIYLSGYDRKFFQHHLTQIKGLKFHCFLPHITEISVHQNITFYPIRDELFTQSMIGSHGVITGGGFETPAEAIFLKKKLMCIPIKNHYEQYCNAAALMALGVAVRFTHQLKDFASHIDFWLNQKTLELDLPVHDIDATLQKIMVLAKNDPN